MDKNLTNSGLMKILDYAVEITKAYYGNNVNSANNQDVTKFIEDVFKKLVELIEKDSN